MAMKPMENSFTMSVLLSKAFIPHGKLSDGLKLGGKGLGGGLGSSALAKSGAEEISLSAHSTSETHYGPGETPGAED